MTDPAFDFATYIGDNIPGLTLGDNLRYGHPRALPKTPDVVFVRATAATDAEKCDVFRRVALIDPPYLIKSRRSGKRLYRHELTTKQHNRILTAIKKINASETAIIVCGYANELYDRRLRNWRTSTLKTTTRRGPATEKIWLNFPPPSRLQDHSFLGSNKRQRERLNRIRRNEVGKIKRKPPLERAAFFQMLREQFPAEFQTPGV